MAEEYPTGQADLSPTSEFDEKKFLGCFSELNILLEEANNAYINWIISEFLLKFSQSNELQITPETTLKIKNIVGGSKVKRQILRSRDGASLNILGLEVPNISLITDLSLSALEKKGLREELHFILEEYITQTKKKIHGFKVPNVADLSPTSEFDEKKFLGCFSELNILLEEANNAYINWIISEFLLKFSQSNELQITPETTLKIKNIVGGSKVKRQILRSRDGASLNILGLEVPNISLITDLSLSALEKKGLREELHFILEEYITQTKKKIHGFKGPFGALCDIRETTNERHTVQEEFKNLEEMFPLYSQLILDSKRMIYDLKDLQKTAEDFQSVQANYLLMKHRLLHYKSRSLRLKIDISLMKNIKYVHALDILGQQLKESAEKKAETLKSGNEKIKAYERKIVSSENYRDILEQYTKIKRQLESKKQTLIVLESCM